MRSLGARLGAYLAEAMPRSERIDAIVPMPIHWTRRLTRGFNQCESLASELSRHTGLPVLKALTRTRRTQKQSSLAGAWRRRNVKGSFSAAHAQIRGKRLLLVDDVLTTGSTVNEAAAELKRHGAARVAVLTVARVDRRGLLALQGNYVLIKTAEETKLI
jgi:ComF family protein